MEDSYIIANYHTLCRLCLGKSAVMVSVFGNSPDEGSDVSLTSKIANCVELQIDPNDGLPGRICYKCLYKLEKSSKFKLLCTQNDSRLRDITTHVSTELENSNSSDISNYNYSNMQDLNHKPKSEDYVVEDSVVMVVDPSLDYDSSDQSENGDTGDRDGGDVNPSPEGEPVSDSFFKNAFMCQFCDYAFISQDKCKEHEENYHDPNMPYNCSECSVVFAERTQYIQHAKQVHGNDKPYNCPVCDKNFGRRSDLRKHSIVHTGIRPYQCHFCLKSFSRNTNLSKHLRIHSGQKPHVCPLCPRSFVVKGDLQRHVLVHSGMKPYACRKCPLTFGRRDKLLKHEVRHGPISPDHKDENADSENEHSSQEMITNSNPYSNILTSPNQLAPDNETTTDFDLPRVPDHISGESIFASQPQKIPSTSGKVINSNLSKPKMSNLNKNKPKNIKCHHCTKRFSSLDAYKTHLSIHLGLQNFQCKICFKKFTRKRELDRHAALHAGNKQFACSHCDKKFARKDKMVRHERTHDSTVINMPCIECGATFAKKADLVAHIKSHFTDECETKYSENDIKKEIESEYPLDDNFYDLET